MKSLEQIRQEKRDCAMVSKDWRKVRDIPPERLTYAICMEAVCRDGIALGAIPKNMQTPRICAAAIYSGRYEAAGYIRDDLLNRKTVQTALEKCFDPWDELHAEVKKFVGAKMAMQALRTASAERLEQPADCRPSMI